MKEYCLTTDEHEGQLFAPESVRNTNDKLSEIRCTPHRGYPDQYKAQTTDDWIESGRVLSVRADGQT